MFLRSLILCSVLIMLGCNKPYGIESIGYHTQQETAIDFYKNNISTLKLLTTQEEMLGWVLKCDDVYKYTNPKIGGLENSLNPSVIERNGCVVSALLHTHPRQPRGWTVDFFSQEDIQTSFHWDMYLLSQENCNVRFGSKLKDRDGVLLGKLKTC